MRHSHSQSLAALAVPALAQQAVAATVVQQGKPAALSECTLHPFAPT